MQTTTDDVDKAT